MNALQGLEVRQDGRSVLSVRQIGRLEELRALHTEHTTHTEVVGHIFLMRERKSGLVARKQTKGDNVANGHEPFV